MSEPTSSLPARARIVIIGGGVMGASIAYHLAHAGERDVVVLERDRLTSGTTWHAAGLMTTFGSTSQTITRLRLYSRELYARLEAETGQSTGFKPVGLIEAAADTDRLEEYRRAVVLQRRLGLEVEEISPAEMATMFPLARTDDLLGGFWVPGDGRVNPVDVTMALAKGAKALGVRILERCPVQRVLTRDEGGRERVVGVRTSAGDLEAEIVINCAGMWARQLGERDGVVIPNQAAEHYYLITEPLGADPTWPVFEDPAAYGYYREEGGGLMVGLFEPEAAAWSLDGIPEDFSFGSIPYDWERIAPALEVAMRRIPALEDVGVRTFFCGPESFTPDRLPAVGEAPGIAGYFVTAGLNSVGILSAGGLGQIVAEWVTNARPEIDVTAFDVARFHDFQLDPAYRAERTAEVLGSVYAAHVPGSQFSSGRGMRRSPVHSQMEAAGAFFRDVSGWESADWYAGPGERAYAKPSWGRGEWFVRWRAEHEAVRHQAGLFDLSFRPRVRVTGPDAQALLTYLSSVALTEQDATLTSTPWLDEHGGMRAAVTVTRRSAHDYLVSLSGSATGPASAWLRKQSVGWEVDVVDETQECALLSVQGPLSREVLTAAAGSHQPGEGLSLSVLPEGSVGTLKIAGIRTVATRISDVGELGYELLIVARDAPLVWERLIEVGRPLGVIPCGLHALDSLRLEVGYRDYGQDVGRTDSLLTTGLESAIEDAPGRDFLGRGALGAQLAAAEAQTGVRNRLVQVFLTDPGPLLFGAEVLRRDGVPVGELRSASYGWSVGGAVAVGSVQADTPITEDWLGAGRWEVDSGSARHTAQVSLRPWREPASGRAPA